MKNSESIGAEMLQKSHVDILEKIVALQDKSYQAFQSKLMPTVPSETWTRNKTIQKAVESFRITPEMKQRLRMLRIRS